MDQHLDYAVPASITVSIPGNGLSSAFLPDIERLRGARIVGISHRSLASSASGKALDGKDLVTADIMNQSFLSIDNGGRTQLQQLPLARVEQGNLPGEYLQVNLINKLDTTSCFIRPANGVTVPTTSAYELTFYYYPVNKSQQLL